MSTHDYVIDNQSAVAFRADLNNALAAIVTQNSNATAPTTTFANMIWYDTATNILKKRNEANSAWINLGTVDEAGGTFTPTGGTATIATQAEAEAGTDNTKMMTPLRVFQALKSLTVNVQEFTASGTWTKPADAIYSEIIVLGAGQGGRGGVPPAMCTTAISGIAGNSGGYGAASLLASGLTATVSVTIGAGGTANTGSSGVGGTGGTSSFGAYVSATGGGSTGPGIGSGTGVFANSGRFADDAIIGAPSQFGYGGATTVRAPQRGGGGGGSTTTSSGPGGAGYVRVVTYCA